MRKDQFLQIQSTGNLHPKNMKDSLGKEFSIYSGSPAETRRKNSPFQGSKNNVTEAKVNVTEAKLRVLTQKANQRQNQIEI